MDTETELEVNEKTRHEDKVVHLQMIQGVIDRMSTSAAIYKGFAATIVTGIAAISFFVFSHNIIAPLYWGSFSIKFRSIIISDIWIYLHILISFIGSIIIPFSF